MAKTKIESTETTNYGLIKLKEKGTFDYEDYNCNLDAIDAKLAELAARIAKLDNGSTK